MLAIELFSPRALMVIIAASGYAAATLLMKFTADSGGLLPLAGIATVLAITVAAEVLLMRQVDLGIAYLVVIGAETLLVLMFTYLVGEPLNSRELFGGALVLAGMAIAAH